MQYLFLIIFLITAIGVPARSLATDVGVARTKSGFVIGTNDAVTNTDTGMRIRNMCKLSPVKNGVILFQMSAFTIPVAHGGKIVMKFDFQRICNLRSMERVEMQTSYRLL